MVKISVNCFHRGRHAPRPILEGFHLKYSPLSAGLRLAIAPVCWVVIGDRPCLPGCDFRSPCLPGCDWRSPLSAGLRLMQPGNPPNVNIIATCLIAEYGELLKSYSDIDLDPTMPKYQNSLFYL